MNYKSDHSYQIAYRAMLLVLIPFFFIIEKSDKGLILLFPALIIGIEYAYTFPRQSMQLYEEIRFKSFIERSHTIIQVLLLICLGVCEVYLYNDNKIFYFLIFLLIYTLWYAFFQKQSLLVGNKSIAIGQKLFSYNSISSISFKKKGLVIETTNDSFTIYNWAIGKNRSPLEVIIKELNECK